MADLQLTDKQVRAAALLGLHPSDVDERILQIVDVVVAEERYRGERAAVEYAMKLMGHR